MAFLPAILSTSECHDRIHGELLRSVHIFSHRQTGKFFDNFGEEPSNDTFTFHRAAYFFVSPHPYPV